MDLTGKSSCCLNTCRTNEHNDAEEDFQPSKLGTKEYWDEAYQRELQAFKDIGDVGEIWFGEESMDRVIRWLDKREIPADAAVLDIGTGNGVFLVELAKHGFTNLTGIDYSTASVELSKNVLEMEGFSSVQVKDMDFLSGSDALSDFDLCIDKGTFDAITLNAGGVTSGKERYMKALQGTLKVGGFFVITSCNWTREELLLIFSQGFKFLQELPTPSFQFGGRTGKAVTVLIFERL